MPRLGAAAELLADPDFVEQITRRRYIEAVNALGRSQRTLQSEITILAVVQPAGENNEPSQDGTRAPSKLDIVSSFELRATTETTPADEIIHNGAVYVIAQVDSWNDWGTGHYEAVAERLPLQGLA